MSSTNQYGSRDAWWRTQRIRGAVRARSNQLGIKVTPGGPSGSASAPASMMIDTALISLVGRIPPVDDDTVVEPTRQEFTSSSGTWIVPAGVTRVDYLLVGGGGGGGGGHNTGAGGGGGGGSVKEGFLTVVPGQVYNYTVGAGGAGGTGSSEGETSGVVGDDTTFGSVTAKGGGSGFRSRVANSSGFGKGGNAQSGDTPTTGGSGGGVRDGGGNPDDGAGGGGGGAGGDGNGSTSGGTDNNLGGAGGIGVFSSLRNGITAVEYGKGGRGAHEGNTTFINNNGGFIASSGINTTGMGGDGGPSHNGGANGRPGGAGGYGIIVIYYQ